MGPPVITVPVIINCVPKSLAISSTIPDQTVVMGSSRRTVSFGTFAFQPKCQDAKITYTYVSSVPESFMSLNSDKRTFTIDPSKITTPGLYIFNVTGEVGTASSSFSWKLVAMKPQISGSLVTGSMKLPALSFSIAVGKVSIITSSTFEEILGISSYQYLGDPNAAQFSSFD